VQWLLLQLAIERAVLNAELALDLSKTAVGTQPAGEGSGVTFQQECEDAVFRSLCCGKAVGVIVVVVYCVLIDPTSLASVEVRK
jgi:hypothetical protein